MPNNEPNPGGQHQTRPVAKAEPKLTREQPTEQASKTDIWSYNAVSHHRLLTPLLNPKSIEPTRRTGLSSMDPTAFYFMQENPKIFFVPELCPYCSSSTHILDSRDHVSHADCDFYHTAAQLLVCQTCGWWTLPAIAFHEEKDNETMRILAGQARGELITFDQQSIDFPLEELTRYLAANYKARQAIDPFTIEDAVAEIFKSCGYAVTATPRSRDNGIDLFIVQKSDAVRKAVQIKRCRRKVGAELIRSFAGALLYNGLARGIFVTTGEFTTGAKVTANKLEENRGYRIELMDARRLFDMLKISLRPAYSGAEDSSSPFYTLLKEPLKIAQTQLGEMQRIEI